MSTEDAINELAKLARESGCIRMPKATRRAGEGHRYRKGYEIRFYAADFASAEEIRNLLAAAHIKAGAPYLKHRRRVIQPVYGRAAVETILGAAIVGETPAPNKKIETVARSLESVKMVKPPRTSRTRPLKPTRTRTPKDVPDQRIDNLLRRLRESEAAQECT